MKRLLALTMLFSLFSMVGACRGQLVGLTYDAASGRRELRAIDPTSGTSWVLNTFQLTLGVYAHTFVADPATAMVYFQSAGDNKLYTFAVKSGAYVGGPVLALPFQALDRGKTGLVGITRDASSHNELWSVDPTTGSMLRLNTFDFSSGSWLGTLVPDPAAGRAYAISADDKLYTFNLDTGAILGTPALTLSMWAFDRGATGLVGISYNSSSSRYQFCSIDPATGAVTVLNTFDFGSGLFAGNFTTDPDAGLAYATSSENKLYRFDLTTGAILAVAPLAVPIQTLEATGLIPEPSTTTLLLGGALCWLVYRARGRQ